MRSISILLLTVSMILLSCNKDQFVPKNEIPEWLKTRIAEDEIIIASDSKLIQNYGAWKRYEYENVYLFSYENNLSSTLYEIYDFSGHPGIDSTKDAYNLFMKNKCCERYVWKAPGYIEITTK